MDNEYKPEQPGAVTWLCAGMQQLPMPASGELSLEGDQVFFLWLEEPSNTSLRQWQAVREPHVTDKILSGAYRDPEFSLLIPLHSPSLLHCQNIPFHQVENVDNAFENRQRIIVAGVVVGVRLHFRGHLRTTPALLFRHKEMKPTEPGTLESTLAEIK
ncbi:hypothetical protein EK904_005259 [Melospiza melodia maxima]|nr:hypothetical protein EK904_005259 [Melospiza melodia maxima]